MTITRVQNNYNYNSATISDGAARNYDDNEGDDSNDVYGVNNYNDGSVTDALYSNPKTGWNMPQGRVSYSLTVLKFIEIKIGMTRYLRLRYVINVNKMSNFFY